LLKYISSFEQRLQLTQKVVGLAFIAGIVLSWRLWLSDRFFPLSPVVDGSSNIPNSVSLLLLLTLLISLVAIIFFKRNQFIYLSILSLLPLLLQDQLRWQPWVYIYSLILVVLAISGKEKQQTQNNLRLIIIGTYVWSGIHKLNPYFIDDTFKTILTDFFRLRDLSLVNSFLPVGYSIAFIEILTGLTLIFPRTRKIGVLLSVVTHVFVLAYLSPLGINSNSVVYPWNVAMLFLVMLLFYSTHDRLVFWTLSTLKTKVIQAALFLLIGVLPILNFFDLWDNYLSFSFYSGKVNGYFVAVQENELTKIDKRLSNYYVKIKGLSGGQIIDLNKWCMAELNVPFYPEKRVFKKIGRFFCSLGISEDKIVFMEFVPPFKDQKIKTFSCKELGR
jgi:uncharacterized membrane protein